MYIEVGPLKKLHNFIVHEGPDNIVGRKFLHEFEAKLDFKANEFEVLFPRDLKCKSVKIKNKLKDDLYLKPLETKTIALTDYYTTNKILKIGSSQSYTGIKANLTTNNQFVKLTNQSNRTIFLKRNKFKVIMLLQK